MANTYISRTHSGTATDTKKITYSAWLKFGTDDSTEAILVEWLDGNYRVEFLRLDTGEIRFEWIDSGNNSAYFKTVRKFKDVNAWYHFVFTLDTTLATAGDRIKLYINGVRETEFDSSYGTMNPTLNKACRMNENGKTVYMGQRGNSAQYWTGSMSHIHFVDGTAYQADTFGSTDSTTGEWKINTSPTVTYGNHGWFILKDGNSVTDQSGNGNNCTASGTLTKTEDNPSNVFATFNSLMHFRQPTPLLYGNTGIENGDTQWENGYGTIATPTTGKFYAEFKYPTFRSGATYAHAGIIAVDDIATQASGYLNFGDAPNSWTLSVTDGDVYNNGSSIATYSSISANGIIGLAIDCTNSKLYISVNGTWQNSADPSAGTGGISITSNKEYFVGGKVYNADIYANFGNGYFGTTAVSSAGTNASNNGIFEYDVPTGYTALSTKGLNE